jgi:hypothetical protein
MCNKDTRDLFILCIYACASYLFFIVIRYLFTCARFFDIFVHLFCSLCDNLFVLLFISFLIDSLIYLLFKREKNISDPELCSGISITLTVNHHQHESINIIQQTPPSLS